MQEFDGICGLMVVLEKTPCCVAWKNEKLPKQRTGTGKKGMQILEKICLRLQGQDIICFSRREAGGFQPWNKIWQVCPVAKAFPILLRYPLQLKTFMVCLFQRQFRRKGRSWNVLYAYMDVGQRLLCFPEILRCMNLMVYNMCWGSLKKKFLGNMP